MEIENANDHPFKVAITSDENQMYANSHPFKVAVVEGGSEIASELPEKGAKGTTYILVDDIENPSKVLGVYVYDGEKWLLAAQPIDQAVEKVEELPEKGREGVLYYVQQAGSDTYDLYRWINNEWVKVDTDISLYSGTGQNTDGAMTQKATTDALALKANQTDLANKQDKLTPGDNITIIDNVISATDTTYSNFTGTDGQTAGTAGLVPAPATTDEGKYLKADGTWDTVSAGHTYTAGDGIDISAQDIISATNTGKAKLLTSADYNANSSNWSDTNPANFNCVALWKLPAGMYVWNASLTNIRITTAAHPTVSDIESEGGIIWPRPDNSFVNAILFSRAASGVYTNRYNNVFIYYSINNQGGQAGTISTTIFNVNSETIVDNLTSTKSTLVLSAKQGKTLKDLIDSLVIKAAGAPTTSTVGTVGMLYEDTTNGKLYQCTDATNPYVWEEVGGATYTAGAHISIDQNNEISATYSDFVGSDGINNGVEGLVPAPNFDDVNKYLKGDGTWAEIATPTIEYYTTEELNTLWEAA